MKSHIAYSLILLGLFCGCTRERFYRGRGDVGQFIIQQAVVRCGLNVSTNDLPPVGTIWKYSEDDQGVVIQMPREQYPSVESLLRQTFGVPKLGPADTTDGGKLGVYRLTPKGGGIQFGYDSKSTQVIVLRPLSKQEFGDAMSEAMKDERFWKSLHKGIAD